MSEQMWMGRKVQLWKKGKQYKKLIGTGYYKGSERFFMDNNELQSNWIKVFLVKTGKYKGQFITELSCDWSPYDKI